MSTTPAFETSEGLRHLLVHLHYGGLTAWRDDPGATALLEFTMSRYASLARKHGLDPADAGAAAFDVMRTRAVRLADDPWAVVTHAVQLTLIYDSRAHGLLCSAQQARRGGMALCHDVERLSDHEFELADYHTAFQVEDDLDFDEPPPIEEEPTNSFHALDAGVALFTELGWPPHTARIALEYIASRLICTGSRESAYESLRRDRQVRTMLELDQESWLDVLRAVLGDQHADRVWTSAGRGVLQRLLIGQTYDELAGDQEFADAIQAACPAYTGDSHV